MDWLVNSDASGGNTASKKVGPVATIRDGGRITDCWDIVSSNRTPEEKKY